MAGLTKREEGTEVFMGLCWAAFGRGLVIHNRGNAHVELDAIVKGRAAERGYLWDRVNAVSGNVTVPTDPYIQRWTDIGIEAAKAAGELNPVTLAAIDVGLATHPHPPSTPGTPSVLDKEEEDAEIYGGMLWVGYGRGVEYAVGPTRTFGVAVIKRGRKLSYGPVYTNAQLYKEWRHAVRCAHRCGDDSADTMFGTIYAWRYQKAWKRVEAKMGQIVQRGMAC